MAFFVFGIKLYIAMALSVIELENMEFRAFHGCYPLEQVVGNRFRVNVTLTADLSRAAASDRVDDTINYLQVFEIRERFGTDRFSFTRIRTVVLN